MSESLRTVIKKIRDEAYRQLLECEAALRALPMVADAQPVQTKPSKLGRPRKQLELPVEGIAPKRVRRSRPASANDSPLTSAKRRVAACKRYGREPSAADVAMLEADLASSHDPAPLANGELAAE